MRFDSSRLQRYARCPVSGDRIYLADGQARQAKEVMDSIKLHEALTTRDFAGDEPIDLTALVELDAGGARSHYFIRPRNRGLEIEHQRKKITVITP